MSNLIYKCHTCGKDNPFVNKCGCDKENMPTKVPPNKSKKKQFIVVSENIFGIVYPERPQSIQILAAKHDAPTNWLNGVYPLDVNGKNQRCATLADFDAFRISPKGYDTDSSFDFPKN